MRSIDDLTRNELLELCLQSGYQYKKSAPEIGTILLNSGHVNIKGLRYLQSINIDIKTFLQDQNINI